MLTKSELDRRLDHDIVVPAAKSAKAANSIEAANRARRLRRERRMSESTRRGTSGWTVGLW